MENISRNMNDDVQPVFNKSNIQEMPAHLKPESTYTFLINMNSNIEGWSISPQQGRIPGHDDALAGQTLLHTQGRALLALRSPSLGGVQCQSKLTKYFLLV